MNRLSRSLIILLLALLLAGGLRSVIFAQDVDPSAGDSPQASDFFFLPYVAGGQDLPTTLPPLGPKEPKDATAFTKALNERLKIELPFDNTQAFTDVQRGLIAPLPTQVISTTDGSGDHAFCYFNLRMSRGRTAEVHRRCGEALVETARTYLAPLLASRPIGLTLQVDEGPEVFDGKFGNLHPLFQKKD